MILGLFKCDESKVDIFLEKQTFICDWDWRLPVLFYKYGLSNMLNCL